MVKLSEYEGNIKGNTVSVLGNIGFEQVNDPAFEDMFMRIGVDGKIALYKAPNQDVVWEDTDNTEVAVTLSPQVLLSVTPDQEVTTDDGSYSLSMKLDNTTNQDRVLTVHLLEDSVQSGGTHTVSLGKGETGKLVLLSGVIESNISSGTVLDITVESAATGINIRGDVTASTFKVTKAEAAPVGIMSSSYMDEHADNPTVKEASTLTGFDREDIDVGGKSTGILQYCHLASSGEIHQIGSDEAGIYTKLTSQTTFADGTALADRTLMQYHDAGEDDFHYWRHGVLVTVTGSKTIQLAADFDGYIGYDENGELFDDVTDMRELIVRSPLVALMYLNGTKGTLEWFADERHGIVMDGQTHLMLHMSTGFFPSTGLNLTGIANNQSTFTQLSAGSAGDEDVKMMFSDISTMPKLYREGVAGEWTITDEDNKLGIFRSGKCCYNLNTAGTWSLEEINNDYVVMMPAITNNKLHPAVIVVGQKLHANRGEARDHAPAEFFRINADGLPSHEYHSIGSVIIHNEGTGQVEVGADGEIWTSCKNGFPMGIF